MLNRAWPAIWRISSTEWSVKTPTTGTPAATATTSLARSLVIALGPSAKTTPRYDAPAATACSASWARIRPQILILAVTPGHPDKLVQKQVRSGGSRQGGADQNGVRASRGSPDHILPCRHAALGHRDEIGRDLADDLPGRFSIDFKAVEVSAVHTDDRGARIECGLQLSRAVHFYQRIDTDLGGTFDHRFEMPLQRADDQQDGRSSGGSSLDDLQPV